MFDALSKKMSGILNKLRNSGVLTAADIDAALREVRIALLSADVAVDVAKNFISKVKEEALGEKIINSLSPGQMVVKIVHDQMIKMLGGADNGVDFSRTPTKIMLVGLQGAGKTTTTAKIIDLFNKNYKNKTVAVGSVDLYRPAAIDQLKALSEKVKCNFYQTDLAISALDNTRKFLEFSKQNVSDLLLLDTAGRLQIDSERMEEIRELQSVFEPHEVLLVIDIMTGQEALNIAKEFMKYVNVTGIVLTRADGDAKGGVALSVRAATGLPIKYLCFGEKLDHIERFHPDRIANRMLDMGDVMTLVEKAQMTLQPEELVQTTEKFMSGAFDLNDFASNLKRLTSLGGIAGIIKYLPNFQGISDVIKDNRIDNSIIVRNLAIISSMTYAERKRPDIINGSRRKRIAQGSGTTVQDVNKLLKQYETIRSVMKKVKNAKHNTGGVLGLLKGLKR